MKVSKQGRDDGIKQEVPTICKYWISSFQIKNFSGKFQTTGTIALLPILPLYMYCGLQYHILLPVLCVSVLQRTVTYTSIVAYITTVSSTICTSIPTVSYITACRPTGASAVLKAGAEVTKGPDKGKSQWYFIDYFQ